MKWLRRLALFLLVVGIGLEVGLRLLLGNLAVADLLRWNLPDGRPMGLRPGAEVEYTGYFLKIPAVTQEVNALGYRGPARPPDQTSPGRRVALVGSSHVYGVGVAQADTVAVFLEGRLPPDTEVLNFGVPGMSLEELVPHVQRFVCRFRPDAIVYLMSSNDLEPPMFGPELPVQPERLTALFRHVYTTRVAGVGLVVGIFALNHLLGAAPTASEVAAKRKQREQDMLDQIVGMAGACPRGDAGLGIAQLQSPPAGTPLAELLASQPGTAGVPLLDVTTLLERDELLIPREGHFNAAGNEALAERLDAWLRAGPLLLE